MYKYMFKFSNALFRVPALYQQKCKTLHFQACETRSRV